jgi:hypothetical protein
MEEPTIIVEVEPPPFKWKEVFSPPPLQPQEESPYVLSKKKIIWSNPITCSCKHKQSSDIGVDLKPHVHHVHPHQNPIIFSIQTTPKLVKNILNLYWLSLVKSKVTIKA